VNKVRTVSDTKRAFYSLHTRPIKTIYRRVVEELMVEIHLLSVNIDFHYNPIYALGIVTTFERFMMGYKPQHEKESIFHALIQSVGADPNIYRQDTQRLRSLAIDLPVSDSIGWLNQTSPLDKDEKIQETLQAFANNQGFKYSRLFGIGLYTLLELSDSELVKDEKLCNDALKTISNGLKISEEKLIRDLELYRSNLEKMSQAITVMADMVAAERRKREQPTQVLDESITSPEEKE